MRIRKFVCHATPHLTLTRGSNPSYSDPNPCVVERRRSNGLFSTLNRLIAMRLGPNPHKFPSSRPHCHPVQALPLGRDLPEPQRPAFTTQDTK